jgi:hypothetical protein
MVSIESELQGAATVSARIGLGNVLLYITRKIAARQLFRFFLLEGSASPRPMFGSLVAG